MKNTLLYILIFISYALSSSVDVRIINTIQESGYNVLIDGGVSTRRTQII